MNGTSPNSPGRLLVWWASALTLLLSPYFPSGLSQLANSIPAQPPKAGFRIGDMSVWFALFWGFPILLLKWLWELGTIAASGTSFLAPGWLGGLTEPWWLWQGLRSDPVPVFPLRLAGYLLPLPLAAGRPGACS